MANYETATEYYGETPITATAPKFNGKQRVNQPMWVESGLPIPSASGRGAGNKGAIRMAVENLQIGDCLSVGCMTTEEAKRTQGRLAVVGAAVHRKMPSRKFVTRTGDKVARIWRIS